MKQMRQETPEVPTSPSWPQAVSTNLALIAALTAIFFLPVFLHPNKMFWGSDVVRLHSGFKEIQWQSFWHWHAFPLWDATSYCGRSIVGDPIHALLYPPAWIFWLIPAPALFGYFLWFEVALGAWGMFLFARRKGCDSPGALFAAIAFALAGKTGAHIFAGHVELLTTMLGLPWMLWALEGVLQSPRWPRSVLLGGITAFFAFGGCVQMLYWHMLFMAGYVVLWGLGEWLETPRKPVLPALKSLVLAGIVFVTAAAPWWFPVVRQTLLLGARARGTSLVFSGQDSATFPDLLRFIWPSMHVPDLQVPAPDMVNGFFWETSSGPGILVLCLAVAAILSLHEMRGVFSLTLLGMASVVLALGENSPFYWLAWKVIPGFFLFRCPGRMFFYTNFLLALLAGLMVSHGKKANPRWMIMLVAGLLFEGTLIGGWILARTSQENIRGLWIPALTTMFLTVLALLWFSGRIRDGFWRLVLVLVLVGEAFMVWRSYVNVVEPRTVLPRLSVAEFLAEQHKKEEFRIYDPTGLIEQQIAARYGLELVTGYNPGISARHLDLYKKIWRSDASDFTEQFMHSPSEIACPTILDLMNARYIVAFEPDLGEGYEKVFQAPNGELRQTRYIYRRKDALPRAWMVSRAQTPPDGEPVPSALCKIDSQSVCLVEDHPVDGTAAYQELHLERQTPSSVTLSCHTDAPGVMVLSETWTPDWRATDNGLTTAVRRVNHNFLGIPVGAGDHVVQVWYRPWDFYTGLAFAAPSWLLIIGAAIMLSRRHSMVAGDTA